MDLNNLKETVKLKDSEIERLNQEISNLQTMVQIESLKTELTNFETISVLKENNYSTHHNGNMLCHDFSYN